MKLTLAHCHRWNALANRKEAFKHLKCPLGYPKSWISLQVPDLNYLLFYLIWAAHGFVIASSYTRSPVVNPIRKARPVSCHRWNSGSLIIQLLSSGVRSWPPGLLHLHPSWLSAWLSLPFPMCLLPFPLLSPISLLLPHLPSSLLSYFLSLLLLLLFFLHLTRFTLSATLASMRIFWQAHEYYRIMVPIHH